MSHLAIPVDEDVSFVEMAEASGYSYHAGISERIRRNLDSQALVGNANLDQ